MITRNTALWGDLRAGRRDWLDARDEAMSYRLVRAVLDHMIRHYLLDSNIYDMGIFRPDPTEDMVLLIEHPTDLLTHAVIDPMRRLAMEGE